MSSTCNARMRLRLSSTQIDWSSDMALRPARFSSFVMRLFQMRADCFRPYSPFLTRQTLSSVQRGLFSAGASRVPPFLFSSKRTVEYRPPRLSLGYIYSVLAGGRRVACEYSSDRRLIELVISLLPDQLGVRHATENSEVAEIWYFPSPHLLWCRNPVAVAATRRPIMEVAGRVRCLPPYPLWRVCFCRHRPDLGYRGPIWPLRHPILLRSVGVVNSKTTPFSCRNLVASAWYSPALSQRIACNFLLLSPGRHLPLSEPLVELRTSPGQINPRPPCIVVRERERVSCPAGRGDAEWPPEIGIDPL
jgi:hypothetical protein